MAELNSKKMRAVQIAAPHGALKVAQVDIPEPAAGQVRIKVQACGVCHSDSLTVEGAFPWITYPRIPGHEVAGVIDALGSGVTGWQVGERVGVGWNGGYCSYCDECRKGNFFACENVHAITGVTSDGGYADYMVASATALARLPEDLSAVEAAPLMCAGVTTFNALRNSGARPGELVAVLGLGGLGHLGVQFAVKMGFRTVAIARGADKEALARKLGAWHYIDSSAGDPAQALKDLGGAKVILATVTSGEAMAAVIGGLGTGGTLLTLGAAEPFTVPPIFLLTANRSVKGWYSGTSMDSQDTLAFSSLTGVRSMNEAFPLENVAEAYAHMMSGKVRFRAVLTME